MKPFLDIVRKSWCVINTFPNKPLFLGACLSSLLETPWDFSQCFLTMRGKSPLFSSNLKLLSANSFSLEDSKICHLGTSSLHILSRPLFAFPQGTFSKVTEQQFNGIIPVPKTTVNPLKETGMKQRVPCSQQVLYATA